MLGQTGLSKQCRPRSDIADQGLHLTITFFDTSSASQMLTFKFKDKYGKELKVDTAANFDITLLFVV